MNLKKGKGDESMLNGTSVVILCLALMSVLSERGIKNILLLLINILAISQGYAAIKYNTNTATTNLFLAQSVILVTILFETRKGSCK
jgi:hypothetical protein